MVEGMSLRLEMLQVARLAPRLLGDSAGLVRSFLLQQQNKDGGFKDRSGLSDLYYTVFGLDALIVLNTTPEAPAAGNDVPRAIQGAERYLGSFGKGTNLDFVHLCCLARGWAAVHSFSEGIRPAIDAGPLLERVEAFRTRDGGYNPMSGAESGTAYGAFLALGAYQDMRADLPQKSKLADSLKALETSDGAWTNEVLRHPQPGFRGARGATNATAAAITVLRNLGFPAMPAAGPWLLARAHPQGGFRAAPDAPLPDLLSTATALHALAGLEVPIDGIKESCLDFVDSLWTNAGGFHGYWSDDHLD
jgi:hypothetical protein